MNWERGRGCPFKAKKAKKILPAAGTYIIVNWERGWECPFKAKKAKKFLPAAGTYIIVNWERGWEECPFKARKAKKFCLWQALKLLSTERERLKASFQNQNGQKFCACGRHLYYYCELRERGWGCLFKAKKVKNLLSVASTYTIVNWERLRVPFQGQKGRKISACCRHFYYCEPRVRFCLQQALILLWTERGWGRPLKA